MLPFSFTKLRLKFESMWFHFPWRKCVWKCRLLTRWPFCLGLNKFNIQWLVHIKISIRSFMSLELFSNILVDIPFVSMRRREICWMRNGIHEHRSIYDDGIVRRQFPSMRPLCHSQMANLICFLHKITTINRFQCNHISIFFVISWYHVIIRIKTRSTMDSGTCLTVWQITRPSVSEFDFLWVTCPSALSRQNPTGAVSIPQVIFNKS